MNLLKIGRTTDSAHLVPNSSLSFTKVLIAVCLTRNTLSLRLFVITPKMSLSSTKSCPISFANDNKVSKVLTLFLYDLSSPNVENAC